MTKEEKKKASDKKYYEENKEKLNAKMKIYREKNKEKASEYHKKYREENKEKLKSYFKRHQQKNKEKLNAKNKKYYQENKERLNAKNKKWRDNRTDEQKEKDNVRALSNFHNRYKTDPLFKTISLLRCRTGKVFKSKGYKKNGRTHEILGADYEVVKNHIESQFYNGMTWENQGEWHIDHITPLSSANTEEEMKELFHWTNLQPLWAIDNLKKNDSIPLVCRF